MATNGTELSSNILKGNFPKSCDNDIRSSPRLGLASQSASYETVAQVQNIRFLSEPTCRSRRSSRAGMSQAESEICSTYDRETSNAFLKKVKNIGSFMHSLPGKRRTVSSVRSESDGSRNSVAKSPGLGFTAAQLENLLKPSWKDSRETTDDGLQFLCGPLLTIYNEAKLRRPERYRATEWNEAMLQNLNWPSYRAEFSGLVSFWQAILIAAERINRAMDALQDLTTRETVPPWMVENVSLCMGQLINTIGLSWHGHHVKNLSKLNDATCRAINRQSLLRRHEIVQKKLWAIHNLFQENRWRHSVLSSTIARAHEDYEKFYVYLLQTVQIILEDALFFYRCNLTEWNVSCVGDAADLVSRSMDMDLLNTAVAMMAGATPKQQRMKRFRAMGYTWLSAVVTIFFGARKFEREFARPLRDVVARARRVEAANIVQASFVSLSDMSRLRGRMTSRVQPT
mmetsp:Transcript_23961/g.57108  ORF Transcript_23961/g.57108 Transcript_23961/m.57108 type:complete len:456 (-) Transcript_23961:103-1470(-)